jgi:nuclear polyadenylated RNA-binding protein NAB2
MLSSSLQLCPPSRYFSERGFIDWLFKEAAKGAPESELVSQTQTQPTDTQSSLPVAPVREGPSDVRRNPPSGPRGNAPLYQQAISQALPNQTPTAQKRTASARSPSPTGQGSNKSRRTDLPSGPRAMRDARQSGPPGQRSLLERVGPRTVGNGFPRPDNMPNNMPGPGDMDLQSAIAAGFVPPSMNGMDMNALAAAQMGPNPLLLQEMMMNQMAMMAQMASSLGMMNPGQFGGFPMQAGAQDVGMYGGPGGYNGPPMSGGPSRGRGGYRGGGRGGALSHLPTPEHFPSEEQPPPTPQPVEAPASIPTPIVAPTPTPPQPARPNFAVPERPQSPTLCKFSLKCTNPHCRWSHPSPVATPESGVVLSNEACEQGKDCKDKDCIKGHISPAAVNPALGMCTYFS